MADHRARVEEGLFNILTVVASAASKLQIGWLIAGAAGRVLLLEEVYKLPRGRATADVDVDYGVMVESWDHYQALVDRLCKHAGIYKDSKQEQRLHFPNGGIVDLVPFGGVEADGNIIRWPPSGDFEMSVLGFQEAYDSAAQVLVNDTLIVRVVSPEGLLLLKFIAWKDRHNTQPGRDASDIGYLLHHGTNLFGDKNLFDEHHEIVESTGYDLGLAAAWLLGIRMGAIALERTRTYIDNLLEQELENGIYSQLVREVAKYLVPAEERRALDLLSQVRTGLTESNNQRI